MWKKKMAGILAVVALCGSMAVSAADYTILEKADKVETTVYGTTQTGSLNDRITALDKLLNGKITASGSLQDKTNSLYNDVYGNTGSDLSLLAATNLMQWQYSGQITDEPILVRISALEEGIDGKVQMGALSSRVQALRYSMLGNKKYISQEVMIPVSTLVTMKTLEPLDSKTAQEGETVQFAVADDVVVDGIVAIPRGMEATGTITKARKSGRFGKDGKIEITFHSVRAADSTPVDLIVGEKTKEEYKRTAGAVGASAAGAIILGPVGLVGGLFVHGNDVNIPEGTTMYAETAKDTDVVGFKQNGTIENLKTANMAASGVTVPSAVTDDASTTGYHGDIAPVDLPDTTAADTNTTRAEQADTTGYHGQAASVDIQTTGDVHE